MASLPKFFVRKNSLRFAVAGAIAVAGVIAVTVAIAITGPAKAAATPAVAADPVQVTNQANAAPTWDRLAQCESNGNWSANTGNGFSGGLQFTPATWHAYGGEGAAHTATRAEQITVAERILADQGWDAWPACSAKLDLH